jgi:hypothetical protein
MSAWALAREAAASGPTVVMPATTTGVRPMKPVMPLR